MAYAQPFPLSFQAAQRQQQQQKTAHIFGPDLAVRLICPECRDPRPDIVEEFGSGDLVCRNCGLILGDRIVDTRSEWRVSYNFFTCHHRPFGLQRPLLRQFPHWALYLISVMSQTV